MVEDKEGKREKGMNSFSFFVEVRKDEKNKGW